MWTWAEPGVSNAFASVPPSLRVYTPIQDGRSNPSFIAFPFRSTVGISATFFTKKAPISNMCCISCNGFRWVFSIKFHINGATCSSFSGLPPFRTKLLYKMKRSKRGHEPVRSITACLRIMGMRTTAIPRPTSRLPPPQELGGESDERPDRKEFCGRVKRRRTLCQTLRVNAAKVRPRFRTAVPA